MKTFCIVGVRSGKQGSALYDMLLALGATEDQQNPDVVFICPRSGAHAFLDLYATYDSHGMSLARWDEKFSKTGSFYWTTTAPERKDRAYDITYSDLLLAGLGEEFDLSTPDAANVLRQIMQ